MDEKRPYKPPLRSGLRERALQSVSRRASAEEFLTRAELLQARERDLSPVYIDALTERVTQFEDFRSKSLELLRAVRRQDELADEDEQSRALHPSRDVDFSLYRSSKDRNAAILGVLERERRRNAPVSRATLERAKALAASRRQFRKSRGLPQDYDYTQLADCIGADRAQRVRRQVMFGLGLAERGYSGSGRIPRRC